MDKSTSTLRFQVWTECVRECHTSGMTVKAWCEQTKVYMEHTERDYELVAA